MRSFSGPVPSELGLLTRAVEFARFQNNRLQGPIPSELGQLTALTRGLNFEGNSLYGSIPSELGALTAFKQLFQLGSNDLSGSIPSQLGRLSKLTNSFELQGNSLCGSLPSEVAGLSATVTTGKFDVATGNQLGSVCCEAYPQIDAGGGLTRGFTCPPTPVALPIRMGVSVSPAPHARTSICEFFLDPPPPPLPTHSLYA